MKIPKYVNPSDFALFSTLVLLAGLIYSPFVLSGAMWCLALAAVWHQFMNTAFLKWNTMVPIPRLLVITWERIFQRLGQNRILWPLALLLFVPMVSGIWSTESAFWLTNFRVRIPFLTLALTFANLPQFNQRQIRIVTLYFIGLMTISCIGVGIYMLTHLDEVMELLKVGKPVPVPRSHIRFSLSVAIAVVWVLYALRQITFPLSTLWRRTLMFCGVFLFLFLHVLSVRSGLVAMYAGIIVFVLHQSFKAKAWAWAGAFILGLFVTCAVAIRTIPSLQMKLSYMSWDLDQYQSGQGGTYSDSGRMASMEAGWALFKESPLFGTGMGDLPKATERVTLAKHPEFEGNVKLPHNQFMFILAGTGLFGLLLSLFGLYGWLRASALRSSSLFVATQAIAFVSFLVEFTLETSIGVAFFLIFYCWTYKVES